MNTTKIDREGVGTYDIKIMGARGWVITTTKKIYPDFVIFSMTSC